MPVFYAEEKTPETPVSVAWTNLHQDRSPDVLPPDGFCLETRDVHSFVSRRTGYTTHLHRINQTDPSLKVILEILLGDVIIAVVSDGSSGKVCRRRPGGGMFRENPDDGELLQHTDGCGGLKRSSREIRG